MTTPIERLDAAKAALDAHDAAAAALRAEYAAARDAVLAASHETGATQYKTPRYTVSVGTRRSIDPAGLLAWTRTHAPQQIQTVEEVRPAYAKAFADSLVPVAGEYVTPDGELVEFVTAVEYLSVRSRGVASC